jgi:hypothetical protein
MWHLDHDDDNPLLYLGASHARCNTSWGAAKGNRKRVRVRRVRQVPAPIPPDDPARGIFYGPEGQLWSRLWMPWR